MGLSRQLTMHSQLYACTCIPCCVVYSTTISIHTIDWIHHLCLKQMRREIVKILSEHSPLREALDLSCRRSTTQDVNGWKVPSKHRNPIRPLVTAKQEPRGTKHYLTRSLSLIGVFKVRRRRKRPSRSSTARKQLSREARGDSCCQS